MSLITRLLEEAPAIRPDSPDYSCIGTDDKGVYLAKTNDKGSRKTPRAAGGVSSESLLDEGDAAPGFDIPMVLKVTFPGMGEKGIWYVETKPDYSKQWAVNRAVAAIIRSTGEDVTPRAIKRLLHDHPPTAKDVSNENDGDWTARSRFIPVSRPKSKGF